jgi:hypothetical protein
VLRACLLILPPLMRAAAPTEHVDVYRGTQPLQCIGFKQSCNAARLRAFSAVGIRDYAFGYASSLGTASVGVRHGCRGLLLAACRVFGVHAWLGLG